MSPGILHLRTRGNGRQPVLERGVRHVGGGPVDCIHLLPLNFNWHIDEVARVTESGAAPDNVWRGAVIPNVDLCHHTLTLVRISEVGNDVVESLLQRVQRLGLERVSANLG